MEHSATTPVNLDGLLLSHPFLLGDRSSSSASRSMLPGNHRQTGGIQASYHLVSASAAEPGTDSNGKTKEDDKADQTIRFILRLFTRKNLTILTAPRSSADRGPSTTFFSGPACMFEIIDVLRTEVQPPTLTSKTQISERITKTKEE